ncbi:hypothetical protein E6H35_02730 [Candidatus Bathyarchaeota archaeon]|nr:MAG: hypothetical protein E6H35_02730 [Candidatus Bathyarchaeota archaeon]
MKRIILLVALFLITTAWIMPFGTVHASPVATSLPGVKPGDNATYVFPNPTFKTNNSTAFPNVLEVFNVTSYVALRITTVSGANVTFTTTFYLHNGTSFYGYTDTLNVQTLSDCRTFPNDQTLCSPQDANSLSFVLAAGLQAPEAIGAIPSITLNQTVTRTILGTQRTVNFLNETLVFPGLTSSFGIAFDQASGILVGAVISFTESSTFGSATGSYSIVLASTNIWTSSPADFSISSNPSTVTIQGGESGSSTITLTSLNGFTGTVTLQAATSSPQISCSLSDINVTLGSSATSTISCRGSMGQYVVTVTGTAGNLSHSTTLTYTVLHGRRGHHA